jgi:hypothetical protein
LESFALKQREYAELIEVIQRRKDELRQDTASYKKLLANRREVFLENFQLI